MVEPEVGIGATKLGSGVEAILLAWVFMAVCCLMVEATPGDWKETELDLGTPIPLDCMPDIPPDCIPDMPPDG